MRVYKRLAGLAAVAAISASLTVPAVSATNIPTLLCPWGCGPTESDQMLMNMQIKD